MTNEELVEKLLAMPAQAEVIIVIGEEEEIPTAVELVEGDIVIE